MIGASATATLSGCGSEESSDTDGEETDTATATQEQDQTATETDQDTAEEHDGRPSTEYQLDVHEERENGYPLWIDQDGRMYGRYATEVMVSDDRWETTEMLYSFEDEDDRYVQAVIVPDGGNIIVAVGGRSDAGGTIYRLHDDRNGAETLYQFDYGRVSNSLGHVVHDDIIVISSYKRSDFEAGRHANEVILSTDGGESFDRVLEAPLNSRDAANLHIHDVEYDPYAERIWVAVGDHGNAQIYWSDDLGSSWETIAEQGAVTMITQVAAFEDCVAFGTDGAPEGIIRWEREGPDDEPDGVSDLDYPHVQIETDPDDDTMEMYARRRWHIREDDGRELCLMPFGYSPMHETASDSVVLASVDGNEWYELYRTETRETLLTNIMGPLSMDGDLQTFVSDSNQDDGYQVDATVPKFWK